MALSPGTHLGTYHIIGTLGAGGMGEVYRARDTRLGREVAVKVLPGAVAASVERLARFEREARTVAGLNHPNIVTLFSVEEEDGVRFLTMELVEGQSLDRLVTPGGLPVPQILDLGIPLAAALSAAHERGVVHRDLKPGNVMVTPDGWVKVLDFGLAKASAGSAEAPLPGAGLDVTAGTPLSREGQVLGTAPYMAPEQVRGGPADPRSDLFALGIILYELTTGQRPFTGATPADVGSAILRDAPVPILSLRGDLPRDLHRIIARCLEKKPTDRFQTARDVHNELRYVKREMEAERATRQLARTPPPAGAPDPAAGTSSRPPVSPHPSSAGGAAVSAVERTPGRRDVASIAVLPFVNRSRAEEDEYFSDGLADELLNVLTKVPGLRVAARASSFQFKGRSEDLAVIGERLNVVTLLDGSVRKSGNRVRISVQLVQAADRVQLWSETYDRSLDDIFAVQDDIAQSVVKELRVTLLGETPGSDASRQAKAQVAAAAKGHGQSPEAHRLYLQGKYFVDRVTQEDTAKGIRYLEQALALDPTHAAAWADLARAHANSGGYGWEPVFEAYRSAREAAERALALEPDLAQAHARLSIIQRQHDWDLKKADASGRRALELAPGNADVLRTAGGLAHILCRFEEAEALFQRALEQDPLNGGGHDALGRVYRSMGRPADAERELRKAIELAPQRVSSRGTLGVVLAGQERYAEALEEADREPAAWARLWGLAYVHWKSGRRPESDEALRQLMEERAADAAFQIAAIHAVRGEADAAFEWLERSFAQRDAGTPLVKSEPMFGGLHGDPRWGALLRRIGLPE
jgi:serine/threonine protein kinase/Tfp pilus assembly protein PilF